MKNKLYHGDNLTVLRNYLKDESVDLCYIDPPFNSKRNYHQIDSDKGKENKALAFVDTWIWDDDANQGLQEIQSNDHRFFTHQCIDLIEGLTKVLQKGSLLAYLISMTLRIAEIQRVLKPTGSFYLHCDPTASHYLKLILDTIFCAKGGDFRNEIIWGYVAPSAAKKDFPRKHDVIFRYTKSDHFIFNADAIRIPYSDAFVKRRKYSEGKSGIYSGKSSGRNDNELEHFVKGKLPPSWWTDIKSGGQMPRKEWLGYPTQKPEALLERIIKASSHENDVVLDAYCGCGTTIVVAEKLQRQWIGIDKTYQGIALTLKRLEEYNANSLTNIELNDISKDLVSA
jgi:site-specific DNA-methyltransferase (adenine-specific)